MRKICVCWSYVPPTMGCVKLVYFEMGSTSGSYMEGSKCEWGVF